MGLALRPLPILKTQGTAGGAGCGDSSQEEQTFQWAQGGGRLAEAPGKFFLSPSPYPQPLRPRDLFLLQAVCWLLVFSKDRVTLKAVSWVQNVVMERGFGESPVLAEEGEGPALGPEGPRMSLGSCKSLQV